MMRSLIRRSLGIAYLTTSRGRVFMGRGCQIPFHTLSIKARQVRMGEYVRFGKRVSLEGNTFVFGDHSSCGSDVKIQGHAAVFALGKFSLVGARTAFLLGQGRHRLQTLSNFPFGYLPEFDEPEWTARSSQGGEPPATYCTVGHDVYIGVGCLILPNVTIGDGAVVSAGSVVKYDVPPYAIVGGHPAQVISFRFKQSLINELLQLKWWDWPMDRILRNKTLLTTSLVTRASLDRLQVLE